MSVLIQPFDDVYDRVRCLLADLFRRQTASQTVESADRQQVIRVSHRPILFRESVRCFFHSRSKIERLSYFSFYINAAHSDQKSFHSTSCVTETSERSRGLIMSLVHTTRSDETISSLPIPTASEGTKCFC